MTELQEVEVEAKERAKAKFTEEDIQELREAANRTNYVVIKDLRISVINLEIQYNIHCELGEYTEGDKALERAGELNKIIYQLEKEVQE